MARERAADGSELSGTEFPAAEGVAEGGHEAGVWDGRARRDAGAEVLLDGDGARPGCT